MFGSKRRKAKGAALVVVKQVLAVAFIHRTVPQAFWHDPYVLGALYGLIVSVSRQAAGGPLDSTEQGSVAMEVLEEVSGQKGVDLARRTVAFVQSREPTFGLATERAAKLAKMMATQSIGEMSPEIEMAMQRAKDMKEINLSLGNFTSEIGAVISELHDMWLIQPLRERTEELQ